MNWLLPPSNATRPGKSWKMFHVSTHEFDSEKSVFSAAVGSKPATQLPCESFGCANFQPLFGTGLNTLR
jgi:hypothetical protein